MNLTKLNPQKQTIISPFVNFPFRTSTGTDTTTSNDCAHSTRSNAKEDPRTVERGCGACVARRTPTARDNKTRAPSY